MNKSYFYETRSLHLTSIILAIFVGSKDCSYEYKKQPGGITDKCSLKGYSGDLKLLCQVSGPEELFTIQWYYSMYLPGENNSSLGNQLSQGNVTTQVISQNVTGQTVVSLLTLDVSANDEISGYYWCSVNSSSNSTLNPSQVVKISTDCFSGDDHTNKMKCMGSVNLNAIDGQPRCADRNVSIDVVDAWDQESCPTGTTENKTYDLPTTTVGYESDVLTSTDKVTSVITDGEMTTTSPVTTSDSSTRALPPPLGSQTQLVWISVGIVFALLIVIIAVLVAVIVCLNHKKNKIKGKMCCASSMDINFACYLLK